MKYHITAALGAAMLALAACATPAAETATLAPEAAPEQVADAPVAPSYEAEGLLAATLPEIAAALAAGDITAEALTQAYLDRIAAIDSDGPRLQSVIATNPDALAQARASDARRAAGQTFGPLDGVPILFKDNIETLDPMATTAGSLALKDNITGRDSPLVAGLRAEGAVILGKTNLSQWANFRSSGSVSGWSSVGGQVRNPHMLDRSPCGSSSGTGAAIAASLAAGGVGTETNGSVICPSQVNGLVGLKPTVGILPQTHIVPISSSQDTAGPMTKSVMGAALMMNAMDAGETDYTAALSPDALQGVRVGVMRFAEGENADVIAAFNAALEVLKAQGAELVEIAEYKPPQDAGNASLEVLFYELKATMNEYLASTPETVTTRTLADLIAFNKENADRELAIFGQDLFESAEEKGPLTEEAYLNGVKLIQSNAREGGIDKLLADNNVSVLVGPSGPVAPRVDPVNGDVWPAWAGAGSMAAISGYPNVTVPMGDVHGVPIGISFMGTKNADAQMLAYAYAYEQASGIRLSPKYLKDAEGRPEIAAAMQR